MLKKISKIKSIILLLISIVLLVTVVNGTIAWLKSETNLVVNRFSYGNIKISITEENSNDNENENNNKSYEIIPGTTIEKNTVVTVNAESEDCWLFVKIEKTENFDDFMSYSIDEGWQLVEGYENIYYREVDKKNDNQTFNIIKDKIININSDITRDDLNSLTEEFYPSISMSAYAFQRNSKIEEIDTAKEAWLLVNSQNN